MSKREPGHKEYKYLYQQMLKEETIRIAYKKLRKGKTKRTEIQYIDAHLDDEVQKMHRIKEAGRSYYKRHVSAMISYMGWFSCTDTYGCYRDRIKPLVRIKTLKQIISKIQRRQNNHDRMEKGALCHPA